jgi:hypothetical protein
MYQVEINGSLSEVIIFYRAPGDLKNMLVTNATYWWKRELNYPRKQRSINQSNNINVPVTESPCVFIAHSPAVFTPVVHYGCPQRAFMHNIHTEFPAFCTNLRIKCSGCERGMGCGLVRAGRVDGVRWDRGIYIWTRLKTVWGIGVISSPFVTSAVIRSEQLASRFGRFPLNRRLCVHLMSTDS